MEILFIKFSQPADELNLTKDNLLLILDSIDDPPILIRNPLTQEVTATLTWIKN